MAGVAGAVRWGEDYVKDAVKDLPYASIIMAGVSLVLPLLTNPTEDEVANQDGFSYVTSQMRYYVELEDFLSPENIGAGRKDELSTLLVNLYRLIIDFQVRSILRFYRSRTKNFFRGTIKYDDWDQKIVDIQKADAEFISKLNTAISGSIVQKLTKLVQGAEASHKSLDNFINIFRNTMCFIEGIDRRMSDVENNACLESLQAKPRYDKMRIEHEKGGLFRDAYRWVIDNPDFQQWRDFKQNRQLLWVKGDPGKGKTMLLCGIIDELVSMAAHNTNVAFFFCQADHSHTNRATAVLCGLIYMIVKQQPHLISYLRAVYDDGKGCFQGVNAWVILSERFDKILGDANLRNTYLVIDALDECTFQTNDLLDLIAEKSSSYPRVKWIISSRNWPSISERLGVAQEKVNLSLELNQETISAAVAIYIEHKVAQLAREKKYGPKLRDDVRNYLQNNADDTFLWVALVCSELRATTKRFTLQKLEAFPPQLEKVYERMMDGIRKSEEAELCRNILAVVTTVYEPVTLDELASLITLPPHVAGDEPLRETIALCGSFLALSDHVALVHQSAKDFLLKHTFTPHEIQDMHSNLFSQSLRAMKKLERNIYKLDASGYPVERPQRPNPDPLAAVRYSCTYWIDHIHDCSGDMEAKKHIQHGGELDGFLREKYLNWLEALSVLGGMPKSLLSMAKLEGLVKVRQIRSCPLCLILCLKKNITE